MRTTLHGVSWTFSPPSQGRARSIGRDPSSGSPTTLTIPSRGSCRPGQHLSQNKTRALQQQMEECPPSRRRCRPSLSWTLLCLASCCPPVLYSCTPPTLRGRPAFSLLFHDGRHSEDKGICPTMVNRYRILPDSDCWKMCK